MASTMASMSVPAIWRNCSYRLLVQRIRKELPDLYESLALQYPNPYAGQCRQTLTHYILVHSAIEYFIRK